MKKTIIIMALLLICHGAALGENRLLALPEGEYVGGLLTDGETLYIQGGALYTWRAGDGAVKSWEDAIDLPEGSGDSWRQAFDGLTLFMDGVALRGARLLTDDDGVAEALQLCDIALTDAGTVEARNVHTLAAPSAVRDGGLAYLTGLCVRDGVLYLSGYASDGAVLCAVDSADGSARVEALGGWNTVKLLQAPDGPILAEEGDDAGAALYRVGRDGRAEKLCDLPPFTGGVTADPATGAIYAVLDGRVCPVDLNAGELGTPVSAVPLRIDGAAALGGRFVAWMGDRVAVLDADRPLDAGGVMAYAASFSARWMNDALLDFAVAHPELALARTDLPAEGVLDGMLTQSRDVDVFIFDTRDGAAAYGALLERGYMLPLDGREALRAFYERMYPGIRRVTTSGGAFAALPVEVNGEGLGVGEIPLARLGLSISDVPDTWQGFLDFLEEKIQPRLSDLGPGASFTYADLSAEGFRYNLRMAILNDWVDCAAAAGALPDYGDPRLLALLERVDSMDFTAYGLAPEGLPDDESAEEDAWFGGGYGYSFGSGEVVLVQLSARYDFDDDGVEGTPLLLGFGDDLPGAMPLNMTAAFVNPYTAHADAALDLMEALLVHLPAETEYALCPDLTEPVIRDGYAQVTAAYDERIAQTRAQIAAAAEVDRQEMEEMLAALEREREEFEQTGKWLIPPKKLEWYRAHGDRVCVAAPSWFDKDTSGEAWQLMDQYTAGLIPAREFLDAVNRKARMMALEGE